MSQALSYKVPHNEELLYLDSFDLSFLILTGHVGLVDYYDVLFDIMKEAKHDPKWGPESDLLGKVMTKAWNKAGGKRFTEELRECFDTSGDISVKKKIAPVFKRHKNIGKKCWEEAEKKAREVLRETNGRAREYYLRQAKRASKAQAPMSFDQYLEEAMSDHLATFTTAYPARILRPEVQRMVKVAETTPHLRTLDKFQLRGRIERMSEYPARYLENASDVHVGRMWNFTGIQMAHGSGVTEYMVVAQRDRKVCPECERIDGHHFSVEAANEKMTSFLEVAPNGDPDEAVRQYPFPRVGQLDNLTRTQFRELGLQPPFHGRCFAEGTEVYTFGGWRLFEELAGDELFISRRRDGLLEWTKAKRYFEHRYKGKMVRLTTNSFDLCVTPEHMQPFEKRVDRGISGRKYEPFLLPIGAMLQLWEYRIPRTGWWNGNGSCTKDIAEFMGYYLSEGSTIERSYGQKWKFFISIAQNDDRIKEKITACCRRIPDIGKVHVGKDKVYIAGNHKLGRFLKGLGHSHEKYVPQAIKNATPEAIKAFLEAFVDGDGSRTLHSWPEKQLFSLDVAMTTSSPQLCSDLGELILKVGGVPSFSIDRTGGNTMTCPHTGKKYVVNNDQLKISWNKSKFASSQHIKVEEVEYDGLVRDVELEKNHVLWVRYNGKTCFSGNCRCDVVYLWKGTVPGEGVAAPPPPQVLGVKEFLAVMGRKPTAGHGEGYIARREQRVGEVKHLVQQGGFKVTDEAAIGIDNAIHNFTEAGYHYVRGWQLGKPLEEIGINASNLPIISKRAGLLEEYIAKAPKFDGRVTLWRGMRLKRKVFEKLEVGDLWEIKALSSWSSRGNVAMDFAAKREITAGVVVKLEGGTPLGTSIASFSSYGLEESEVLLSGRNVLKITGKEIKNEVLFVTTRFETVAEAKGAPLVVKAEKKKPKRKKQVQLTKRWETEKDDPIIIRRKGRKITLK